MIPVYGRRAVKGGRYGALIQLTKSCLDQAGDGKAVDPIMVS